MTPYDVTVIGSGPGGYVAAIRCAQLGLRTALIEKYPTLGGTCLNVGCIPSKALLDSSEHYHNAHTAFADHGIGLDNLRVDMNRMIDRKAGVVKANVDGIAYLMKKNKIDVLTGVGSFVDKNHIRVEPTAGGEAQTIESKNVIIATGSKPTVLPFIAQDKERIITSTEALNIREVPRHFMVIGGGVIGLEMASVFVRLGAKVSVIEYADALIPTMDRSLGKEIQRVLKKTGVDFYLSHKVTGATREGDSVTVTATNAKGAEVQFEGDYCLVAVGRVPYTAGLNLEAAGVEMEERGRIKVDAHLQTNVPGIYAIGDVVRGAMLAHKAEEEGVFVAETIVGSEAAHQLPAHPRRGVYLARGGRRGLHRGAAQGSRAGLQNRQLPLQGQRPGPRQRRHRRLREGAGRPDHRRNPGRPHDWPAHRRPHRRGRDGDGVPRLRRGRGPHEPLAPHLRRGHEGSVPGGHG